MNLKNGVALATICSLLIVTAIVVLTASKSASIPNADDNTLELIIHGHDCRQTIHSFGASDAWSCQFIGKYWPETKREQIADWLFSTDLDSEGNPRGIGLTAWRFNIGGGSAQQGEASGIKDEWRRAESFMNGRNSFDWNSHKGQRWFLRAAKQRGVNQFIGFVNSPPVHLTGNGLGYSSNPQGFNLPRENYGAFANYLADVVENTSANDGINFKYISPINEPQWDWTNGSQEGTPAQNSEMADVIRVINSVFATRGITTQMEIPETAALVYLIDEHDKGGRGNQIHSFFNPQSDNYLGNLSHVAPKVAAHSYFSTWPLATLSETRLKVREIVEKSSSPIEYWMSEYCVLENNDEIKGNGRDLGMNTALYVSRVIFSDLVFGNACSWQWWLGVSPYDYKDGLVYVDLNKHDGNIYQSKLLWAMGNFARFIRPGMKRVDISRSDGMAHEETLEGVMSSAYISEDKHILTIVLINYSDTIQPVRIAKKNLTLQKDLKYYITDSGPNNNLTCKGVIGEKFNLPPRSVVTLTNQD